MKKPNQIKAGKNIKESIREVLKSLGGIESFVKKEESVLLKPNYNTADPFPASTAPDFLKAVVDLVLEAGAAKIIIGDSSTIKPNHASYVRANFEKAGLYELEKLSDKVEVIIFDEHDWVEKKISNGKFFKKVTIPEVMDEVDKIIILPCAKTHFIARYTGALKIIVGFMKPSERIKFHLGHVPEKIAEMNLIYKPDLIIMDARKCFITGGPVKGEVREPGLILAGTDRVAIDIEEVKIIQSFEGNSLAGQKPEDLIQIKYATELGIK